MSLPRRAVLAAGAALGWGAAARAAPASRAPHYRLDLTLDTAAGRLAADVALTVPAAPASFLLGRGHKVSGLTCSPNASVSIADTDKPFPGLQRIDLTPNGAGPRWLRAVYEGPLGPTGEPPVNAISPDRVELSADALWYPLSTDFSTRFTLDAAVRGLTQGFVVAAPDTVRMRPGGFTLRRTIPSQDIAFSASPHFRVARAGALEFFARDLESPSARTYRANGAKALAYFTPWFGPLPRGKAVIAIVERRNGTGYSRPGYLVVADVGTQAPAAGAAGDWAQVGYVAHELSHGWWSNADFTGEDYWLVESTAEYSALRFLEAERGADALAEQLTRKAARDARGGPILGRGRPSDDAVYARGPRLLFALDKAVGRPALDRVLGALARRERITTADFQAELAKAAGADAARDFEANLRAP